MSSGPFGGSILALLAATFIANRLGGGLFRDRFLLPWSRLWLARSRIMVCIWSSCAFSHPCQSG